MKNSNIIISMNDAKGFLQPKNRADQIKFNINCMENNFVAPDLYFCNFLVSSDQTKKKAKPINMNSAVQTGPKIQLGGLKEGLIKEMYHVFIDVEVKIEPNIPMNKGIKTEISNLKYLFMMLFWTKIYLNLFKETSNIYKWK
jgi:hypothetical protein